ncbi:putative P-loop containing nucleoside triphosphate hydrolase [Helianthus annuus]|nr:putative P-loop containing nucleoside triphosphate hydrolase [Helianthus annuus]
MMESAESYPLELLSYEEALSLFARHALGIQNFDVNKILKLRGEDIVKKCGRLPLALNTLGRVFRTKSNVEEWQELLNSEIWGLNNESDILHALILSYYDLSPRLKQMFVYCCLFPKDYLFDKDEV